MSETLQVTATLLPVGQEIHAKAGDRLMMVAGVVVGVFTGTLPKPPPALPASEKVPRTLHPAPPPKRQIAKGQNRFSADERAELGRRVLALFETKPGAHHSTELYDLLGFPRGNTRWKGQRVLDDLTERKLLTRERAGISTAAGFIYRLAGDKQAKAGKSQRQPGEAETDPAPENSAA